MAELVEEFTGIGVRLSPRLAAGAVGPEAPLPMRLRMASPRIDV
jgi:hypothetical protein